jgi:hypothetical protein
MRPEDFFCKIRNTVNSTTDTLITLDHELFFYLQQILDIGGECDFSEVSSTVNLHKFVVPANRFKKVEDEIAVVVSDLTLPWVGKTEANFERGQHECMLCVLRAFVCHFA